MTRTSNRILIAMVSGAGLLVLVGLLALLLTGRRKEAEFPQGSPEWVAQSYIKALDDSDWEKAYSYLSDSIKDSRLLDSYKNRKAQGRVADEASRRVLLESSEVKEAEARITVSISTFRSSGPIQTSEYTFRIDFRMRKEGEEWKIVSPTYPPYF